MTNALRVEGHPRRMHTMHSYASPSWRRRNGSSSEPPPGPSPPRPISCKTRFNTLRPLSSCEPPQACTGSTSSWSRSTKSTNRTCSVRHSSKHSAAAPRPKHGAAGQDAAPRTAARSRWLQGRQPVDGLPPGHPSPAARLDGVQTTARSGRSRRSLCTRLPRKLASATHRYMALTFFMGSLRNVGCSAATVIDAATPPQLTGPKKARHKRCRIEVLQERQRRASAPSDNEQESRTHGCAHGFRNAWSGCKKAQVVSARCKRIIESVAGPGWAFDRNFGMVSRGEYSVKKHGVSCYALPLPP